MYCKNCGYEISPNDKFCVKCGKPVESQDFQTGGSMNTQGVFSTGSGMQAEKTSSLVNEAGSYWQTAGSLDGNSQNSPAAGTSDFNREQQSKKSVQNPQREVYRPEQEYSGPVMSYEPEVPKKNNSLLLNVILGVVAVVLAVAILMASLYLKAIEKNTPNTYGTAPSVTAELDKNYIL